MILPDILQQTVRHRRQRPAILDDAATLTWGDFHDRVSRAAGLLKELGAAPGRRFATLMRNRYQHAELLWAGYWSGCVPVPVNWRLAPPEIAAILADAGIDLVIAEDEFAGALDKPCFRLSDYEARLAAAAPLPSHAAAPDDTALVLYTGGTTGRSKGVCLSHANIIANAQQIGLGLGMRPADVWLHAAPMFHAADLLATVVTVLGGGHVYLPAFSGRAAIDAIARHRITATMLAPTMVKMIVDALAEQPADISSLRLIYYGSSPMPVEWIRQAVEALPDVEIVQGYGLTETAPILTVLPHEHHVRALATGDLAPLKSCGHAVPLVDLRVVDDDGNDLPTGAVGEVVVRGANVMTGYLGRPEETAAALRGGWFHTGDVGRFDADGLLTLLDRKKDMIITGGENVYSTEVEAAIHQHPDVLEAAVIGVPDATYGEAVVAVVAPRPGARLKPDEVIQHCRGRIAGYKIPRRVAVVEALPRSAVGKILKGELRKSFAE